jgi:hypothetical protein
VLPLQQPAQLVGPQGVMQTPLWQTCPAVHAAQTAPLLPHMPLVCPPVPKQVLPLQHPAMQLFGPQAEGWQLPFWQRFAPVQAAQATPPEPHCALLSLASGTQVLPTQQPAQLAGPQVGVQVPTWQVSVPVQAAQATPPRPHWVLFSPLTGMQVVPAQQPVQLVESQLPASGVPESWLPASGWPLSLTPLSGEPESGGPPSGEPESVAPASPPPPSGAFWQTPEMQDWVPGQAMHDRPLWPHWLADSAGRGMQVVRPTQQPVQVAGPQPPPSAATQVPPWQALSGPQVPHTPPTGPHAVTVVPG